jgi:microcystin-dependent protein
MFPDLFDAIGTTYGAGDGSTTFNLPNYSDGKFPEGSTVAGTVKQPGLPNIEGDVSFYANPGYNYLQKIANGAFYLDGNKGTMYNCSATATSTQIEGEVALDASLSNSIYGASNTVQPYSCTVRYIIKAYDGVTPAPSQADISEMLTELTGKADRDLDNLSADGENHFLENDFTIIYPNGGSEASPANVTNNSRYVENNPFPGYYVYCVAELQIENEWGSTGNFYVNYHNGGAYGTGAWQLNDSDIVIATGDSGIIQAGFHTGTPLTVPDSSFTTAPCRVKVWKIGKIPD